MSSESAVIRRIRKRIRVGPRVRTGIGDDTAVIRAAQGKEILFTTDMLIEGRHFRLDEASARQIGRKALAVNISDIAAMGGVPTQAVVSLGLPKRLTGRFVDGLYQGLLGLARQFGIDLVGGDTNRADKLTVNIALLGEVEKGRALLRSGARAGDKLFVSGALGGSYASGKHLNFTPRVREARYLSKNFSVHAMMDLSDGLSSDARKLAEESGTGVLIEERLVPVSRAAKSVSEALTEGEDFELLFAVSPKDARRLPKRFRIVGRIVPRSQGMKLLKKNGKLVPLTGGFDHFR